MLALSESKLVFGLEDSRTGERQLQNALGAKLEHMTETDGWSWRYHAKREEKFKTSALTNKRAIAIDLVGRHPTKGTVAIELKYVTTKAETGKPSDPPAFSWDVAKDCLKLDLLRAGLCDPGESAVALPDPSSLQTYVLGMTNSSDYWQRTKPWGGWAENYVNAVRATPVRFEDMISTRGSDQKNCYL